jgi:hypothetical protein
VTSTMHLSQSTDEGSKNTIGLLIGKSVRLN